MKGMYRFALSSYALVLGLAAPAQARQETVSESRVASLRPAILDRSMATTTAYAPARRGTAAVRLPYASSAAADTLAVQVEGPRAVPTAALVPYRAALMNSAAHRRYYFWWFAANCARRSGCAPTSYVLVAEGEGRDSVTLPVPPGSAERNLVVQVAELEGPHRTGSSPMFSVTGPARRSAGGATPAAKPSCDWFAGSFYPHTGDYTDPYTGQSWPRKFRRDYCGNRVQWDPEG